MLRHYFTAMFVRLNQYLLMLRLGILTALLLALSVALISDRGEAAQVLTIDDVRRLALEHNRTYLSAKEEIAKAESEIMTARAEALPEISLDGAYNRNLKVGSFFLNPADGETIEFKNGFKNDFSTSLSLTQTIWQGGRVINAYKIASQYKKYTLAGADQVRAAVINFAEKLFYGAILQESNLATLQKAFESNSYNLEVVEKQHAQGVVSEFELLRARVEKANLLPQILQGESEAILSQKRLKSFLGLDLNEELTLVEETADTSLTGLLAKEALTDTALMARPEMIQAGLLTDITKKAISVARADYQPELSAVSSYNWSAQSDDFTMRDNNARSWSAGIRLSFPIFNGGATRGRVKNYVADHNQTRLAESETRDAVKLEVEEAYDRLLQAKEAVEVQGVTIAQAEEGLKIANLRYQSGVGTQLEVLSAQTALTQARNSLAHALYSFREAKSNLKKATTLDIL